MLTVETFWTAEHLGEEVLNLLIVEVFLCLSSATPFQDLGHDSAFVVFRSHYTVAVHLWLSPFADAYRSAGLLMTSTVSYHVEEACNILHSLIPNSSIETDPKMTRSPTHAKKPTRAASVRTANKTRARILVTPRPRKGLLFRITYQLYYLTKFHE
ncbi:uncharacterized protein F5147DRAFT_263003 [Suillus discolor]|uniref:Uncharacterized protein n=1 Tax=Suillus discolor TaxID=1912936 RepID=A0A9P7F3Z1_9AGAM|nr:uncharacterized protein F5147DRAFT_263003 [Suillus discolor]KAG2104717.1 hypothetical protein F5147DRAFT_263003 [Suillus discolor]